MQRVLPILLFFTLTGAAKSPRFHSHEDAERNYRSPAAKLATGSGAPVASNSLYNWPVKVLSIGHTIASYQNYSGSASDAYFHHGLDIRADAGSDVTAVVGGKVVNIENYMSGDAYWEVAILDDDGYLWQYHHVDSRSIPQNVKTAFQNKSKIATGTKIGEVYYWSEVSFGERYHHIHLNVLGAGEKYLDPFAFLVPLADNSGPEIKEIFLMQNGKRVNGNKVTGKYTLAAEVSDLILHEKFIVPPSSIFYQVDGQWMPVVVWQFGSLPGGSSNTQYVNDFFVSGTCGNYSCRKIVVDLGFKKKPAQVFPTNSGQHQILLRVTDYAGNAADKTFDWTVSN